MPPPTVMQSDALRALYADPAAAALEANDKVAAARIWLLKEKPFFGVLARALAVEQTIEVPGFRLTSNDRLRANPLLVLEARFPALVARIAHVAMHAALGALARRGDRDALRWNVAHDLAIAPLLRAASLPVGPDPVLDDIPPGASAEQIYQALEEGVRPDDLWCDLTDVPPKNEAPPAGTFTRQDDGLGGEAGEQEGQTGGGDGPDNGDDETTEGDKNNDESRDDDSQLDARARELAWKMRLSEAMDEERASGGKTFGEVPAWLDDLVRATIEPPADWAAMLQLSIALLSRQERTFLRPSRRMSALVPPSGEWPDVVAMPGRRVLPAGRLVVVIDTSASIDNATLARFLGALASVATAEGVDEVRLLQADAEVTRDETLFVAELLFQEIAIWGRGGTDFRPALLTLADEARRTGERFTVVYLSDLDGVFPDEGALRGIEVLWVAPGKPKRRPPFGRLLEMEDWRRR